MRLPLRAWLEGWDGVLKQAAIPEGTVHNVGRMQPRSSAPRAQPSVSPAQGAHDFTGPTV
jgi:hypothetical protein